MSTLYVNNLSTASGSTITIPSGKTLQSTDTPFIGTGNVIQVVNGTTSTAVTFNAGGTFGDTGLEVTFTPKDHTNTFYIWFHCPNLKKTTGAGTGSWWASRVMINGTQMNPDIQSGALGYPETNSDQRYILSGHGATSTGFVAGSNTVKLQGSAQSSNSSWVFSFQGQLSTMTVMEIAS